MIPGPHEAHFLRLDSSRARSELAWHPRLEIAEALEWTIEWYQAWQKGSDMRSETLRQISTFQKLSR
jgi:CDP-glucose 4,6-dehydratase